jgi:hypothetical protein
MDETSQVRYKRCHHMHGVYDCARPAPHKPVREKRYRAGLEILDEPISGFSA